METLRRLSSRSWVRSLAIAGYLLVGVVPAFADQFYYSRMRGNGTTETGLFRWDDATGEQAQIGGDGVYLREPVDGNLVVLGLAATSTGTLYGFAVDDASAAGFLPNLSCSATTNQSRLVTIDTTTATVTYAGPWLSGRLVVGAGFDGQGRLWAVDCRINSVIEIDPVSGNTIGTPINLNNTSPVGLHADIDFVGGWGIVGTGSGAQQMRGFDPATRLLAIPPAVTLQAQGFDTYGITGMAFTSHLDARNGNAAARECRLNVLDDDGADELGHVNDRFDTIPAVAVKDADQYTPPSLPFEATLGDMTRANGPLLPNCVYDWGDSFTASLRANNGARHRIVPGAPFLGAQPPDFEMDASLATEGDNDAPLADEDGVVMPGATLRGTTLTLQVTAGNVGPDTRLQAWFDWNHDGTLNSSDEQVLKDETVAAGLNTYDVTVPATAGSGFGLVRFRIATESGLGPTGVANSGEVEDYRLATTGPADIGITVTDNSEAYVPGSPVVYTITATNAGPFEHSSVRLQIPRPAGTTTSSWTCTGVDGATCSAPSGTTYIGNFPGFSMTNTMPAGSSVIITFTVQVPPGFTGNLVQNATVTAFGTGDAPDPNPTNNSASDTNVMARADLAIAKNGPAQVAPGADLAYAITVTNNGPQAAMSVSVDDPTPAGLTFVSTSGACATAFPCVLGDLAAGETRTITATYRLPSNYTAPHPIINTATVTSTTNDPATANNTSTETTDLAPPRSDVQVVKHVSAATVAPGETFTYTLQVKNNGPSDAVNVTATDTLPAQVTFVSSTAGCTASGQLVTCPTIASMTAGNTATFDLVVQLDPAYTGDGTNILNSASVTSETTDPALPNNMNPAGAPPVGPAGADLTLVKTVTADIVAPGETLTYNLLVSNQGPSVASDVVVTDPLPAALTFVSSPTGCTAAGQLVTCPAITALAPGEFTTFTLVAQLDPGYTGDGTDLDNRATVQSPTADPVPGNDTTPPVRLNLGTATADLSSTKVAIASGISPGMTFTYRITVSNAGPSSAADVVVTDALPAPLTFLSSPSGCTAAGQVVTCTRDAILPGTSATFELLVQLSPSYPGDGSDLVNTATVTSTTPDATPENNDPAPAPAPPVGVGEADLTISKTGPSDPVPSGGEATYTLVVTNQGPNAATDVVVEDPTPAGFTFLETAGDCTTPFPCALGTLLPGEARTVTARYAVDPSVTGVVINTATVTSPTPDPAPANGTATAQTLPPPITYHLAEGATGTFFDEDVLIANPNDAPAAVTMEFLKESGEVVTQALTVAARSHATVRVDNLPGLDATSASARIVSEDGLPLAVQRTMTWDATGYGGHTETAVTQPSTRWYFAEGAQGWFETFVLLGNPGATPAEVTLTFLREDDAPVVKTVTVGAQARLTVSAATIPELASRAFGLVVTATQPIVAERAMYFGTTDTRPWSGGHASAGATTPSQRWFYAEGATGTFFDTFILLSNPQSVDAHVTLEYLLADGTVIPVTKVVPAQRRLTVSIDTEADERLHATTVATRILSDVPIVTERSMYWATKPDVFPWTEGHNSFGVDRTASRWAMADGRTGGASNAHTYILLSNPWATTAEVTVTYLRENGGEPVVKTYSVPATTRATIDVSATVPELRDETFGARIEVTNGVTIGVEQSLYWDANGVFWTAGTNAAATRLP